MSVSFTSSGADMTAQYTVPLSNQRTWNAEKGLYEFTCPMTLPGVNGKGTTFSNAIDVAVLMAEAEEKAKNCKVIDNILIAKFDNLHRFESTGDEAWDKKISDTLDYYSSCISFKNEKDYDELTAAEDFTGMTRTEKYLAIYQKYRHCYGENFLDADAVDGVYIPNCSLYDPYSPVIRKFNKEVIEACGGEEKAAKARREALYGDCENDFEVREAIIKKYTSDNTGGKLTRREYYKIAREMDYCGVGGGIGNSLRSWSYVPKNVREIENGALNKNRVSSEYLDSYITPSDIEEIERSYDYLSRSFKADGDYFTALNQITSAFPVSKNTLMQQFESIKGLKL